MRENIPNTLRMLVVVCCLPFSAVAQPSWPDPVNLGPVVNSEAADIAPVVSKDGLSLYFFSDRPGGLGGNDLWVTRRDSADQPWGPPENLGAPINSSFEENAPALSVDGHRLYFASDRPGGTGGIDLYVSRRRDRRDDFGWGEPENLIAVNSFLNDAAPTLFEDDATGLTELYFHSDRQGGDDIYVTISGWDETFAVANLVEELSSPFLDRLPFVRKDGLELFLASNRPGGVGQLDVWLATRSAVSEPWSAPVNLGAPINTAGTDGRATLSFDGCTLYLHSTRPGGVGGFDLYASTQACRGRN